MGHTHSSHSSHSASNVHQSSNARRKTSTTNPAALKSFTQLAGEHKHLKESDFEVCFWLIPNYFVWESAFYINFTHFLEALGTKDWTATLDSCFFRQDRSWSCFIFTSLLWAIRHQHYSMYQDVSVRWIFSWWMFVNFRAGFKRRGSGIC